jgi:hypothetical protein
MTVYCNKMKFTENIKLRIENKPHAIDIFYYFLSQHKVLNKKNL